MGRSIWPVSPGGVDEGAEESGEDSDEERLKGGDGGAHNSDVNLEARPEGDIYTLD